MSFGLAAQWRFHCRVLKRRAPEEQVQDVGRQIRLGDHVFVSYTWEQSEQHGIVCSVGGKDNQGRRGRNDKEDDGAWVVFWSADASRLQCVSLQQFAKGGDMFRVAYPHWVCQCHLPAASTMNLQVIEERQLESESGEEVAKRATGLFQAPRSKAWKPQWAQAVDLEFCIEAKTGSRLAWEIHGRKAIQTSAVPALGFAIAGERPPSKVFGALPVAAPAAAGQVAPPGFVAPGWAPGCPQVQHAPQPQAQQVVQLANHFDASQQAQNAQAQMAQQMWAGQAAWNPYGQSFGGWNQDWSNGTENYMPQQMDFNQMAQMTQQMNQMTQLTEMQQMQQMNHMNLMQQMQPVAMPENMPTNMPTVCQ